jgi:hypothetical protein
MIKMQIIFDEEKVLHERKYSLKKMHEAVDQRLVETYGMVKESDGVYSGKERDTDWATFARFTVDFSEHPWFLDNLKTWLWMDDEETGTPGEFETEDFKEYWQKKIKEEKIGGAA